MPPPAHSISKFRVVTICLTLAAGLLVSADLAILEWRQAFLCREFRSVAVGLEDHLLLVAPWTVIAICQLTTVRRSEFSIVFYASLVPAAAVALVEADVLLIDWMQGRGLWMPAWLFCDQWNWFDFRFVNGLVTQFILAPLAAVLGLGTIVRLSWTYIRSKPT